MSVPRITQILEEEIKERINSKDEATRIKAASDLVSFAILRELIKIRLVLEAESHTEIDDADVDGEIQYYA
jgi:hypothetical protein